MRSLRYLIVTLAILLVGVSPLLAGDGKIRILHVNDFHGFAEPHRPVGSLELQGGAAYLAGAVKRFRAGRPSLLLAAGDMIQGDNWANLFQGASVIELMNAMGFDAMVVGNHEFDFGQEVLQERIRQASFPVLGANVQGLPGLRPFVVKEVGGVRVAVVGLVTPETPHATHPRNVTGLTFAQPAATLREQLPRLRQEADIVVVLSHLGYAGDRKLAQAVPGIDLIVGGHSHTRLERPERVNGTWIVQAYEHGKFLGVLDLTVRRGRVAAARGRLVPIGPGLGPADGQILALVKKYQQRVDSLLNVVVGEAAVDLDAEQARIQETALGNLVTDILKEKTGADAALINGGTLRAGIPRGPVTRKQIYTALPFDNYLVAFRLTGAQVRRALEHGVAGLPERQGRFPQVAGLRFTYRASAPPGQRIMEVEVGGRPLDAAKVYVLATHDFLAAGGDGYTVFGEVLAAADFSSTGGMLKSGALAYNDPGTYLRDVVLEHFQRHSPVIAAVEGRIRALP
jgi:2',3'-cyclic-nucleotide 2'-phosphodiesterase (5'-nucleotidase family)